MRKGSPSLTIPTRALLRLHLCTSPATPSPALLTTYATQRGAQGMRVSYSNQLFCHWPLVIYNRGPCTLLPPPPLHLDPSPCPPPPTLQHAAQQEGAQGSRGSCSSRAQATAGMDAGVGSVSTLGSRLGCTSGGGGTGQGRATAGVKSACQVWRHIEKWERVGTRVQSRTTLMLHASLFAHPIDTSANPDPYPL